MCAGNAFPSHRRNVPAAGRGGSALYARVRCVADVGISLKAHLARWKRCTFDWPEVHGFATLPYLRDMAKGRAAEGPSEDAVGHGNLARRWSRGQ